jgi:hypothetical protein
MADIGDTLVKILLETSGGEGVDRLRDSAAAARVEMTALTEAFAAGEIGQAAYIKQANTLEKTERQALAALEAVNEYLKGQMDFVGLDGLSAQAEGLSIDLRNAAAAAEIMAHEARDLNDALGASESDHAAHDMRELADAASEAYRADLDLNAALASSATELAAADLRDLADAAWAAAVAEDKLAQEQRELAAAVARVSAASDGMSYELADAAAAAAKAANVLDGLGYAMASDVKAAKAFDAALEDIESQLDRTVRAATPAAAAMDKVGDASERASKKAGKGWGQAGIEISRGVEDLSTGGFLGILNNIPGIFTSVASAAGLSATAILSLTGVVSGAATVGYLLYTNWDKVTSAMGTGVVETEAMEMERLANATKRTADEEKRLGELKEDKRINELKSATQVSKEEMDKKAGKGLEDAVAQAGGMDAVVASIVEGQTKSAKKTGQLAEDDGAAEFAFRKGMEDITRRDLAKAIAAGDTKTARGLARGADAGDGSAAQIFDLNAEDTDPRRRAAEALDVAQQEKEAKRAKARTADAAKEKAEADQKSDDALKLSVERQKALEKEQADSQKQQLDDAAKGRDAEAKRREVDAKDLAGGLPDSFMAQAEAAVVAQRSVTYRRGDGRSAEENQQRALQATDAKIRAEAQAALLAGGMDGGRAAELSRQAPGLVRGQVQDQFNQLRGITGSDKEAKGQLNELIQQLIDNQENLTGGAESNAAIVSRQLQQAREVGKRVRSLNTGYSAQQTYQP